MIFDNQIFAWQQKGGISRYFFELISRLQNDSDVEVELPFSYSRNEYLKKAPHPLRRWSLFDRRYFKGQWLLEWPWMRWSRQLNNRALSQQDYHILHPTYYDPYFLDLIGDRPFVVTVHDMIHELHPECFSAKIAEHERACKRQTVERAAHVIAISACTKKDLLRFIDVPEQKISVVYHGFPNHWNQLPDAAEKHLPYILFVGRREAYKGFHTLFEALAPLLKTFDLELICVGGEAFSSKEKARFKAHGLTTRVKQVNVTDTELKNLYTQAELFVFPSRYEGFGLPVLEAFACDCPVALSDTPCFREVAEDAAAYFDSNDPCSIRSVVEGLLRDSEWRGRLVDRGRKRKKKFSWEKCLQQTKSIYQNVLQSDPVV
ncbi:MAG: glycosyltransferase family 1 protein [Lentisphaeria bacterium]|nr:glycosyltransferase family 1 protein [Lentisphaeria bacterium]